MKEVAFIGVGQAYLRQIGGNTGLVPLGNSSTISISQSVEKKELKNHKTPGGGTLASYTKVSSVTASLATSNFNAHNLAIATAGEYTEVAAAVQSSEVATVISLGALVPLAQLPDKDQSITVTGSGGTPTYVDGTDYEMRETGLYVLEGGTITPGNIEVSYNSKAAYNIEALVATANEYELVFDGINTGMAGDLTQRVTGHRVQISPSSELPLISDDYGTLNLDLTFLEDSSVSGTGISKYYKLATTKPA